MPVRRLNHAVLFVRDVAASTAFYADMLGFAPIEGMAGLTGAAFLRAPSSTNDHDLGLFEIGSAAGASGAGRSTVGLYHLAWEVETLADLAEIAARLTERGALVGATDHGTTKALYAKDPDGLELEVMWLVPADRLTPEILGSRDRLAPLDLQAEIDRFGADTLGGIGISVPAPRVTLTSPRRLARLEDVLSERVATCQLKRSAAGMDAPPAERFTSARSQTSAAEPGTHLLLALEDRCDVAVLLALVRDARVARTVVDRRHTERREPGHVGPAELRQRLAADHRHELRRSGVRQAGQGAGGGVGDLDLEARQHPAYDLGCLVLALVRREPVVDGHPALVRDDVAGHSPGDADRVHALAVGEAVDLDLGAW